MRYDLPDDLDRQAARTVVEAGYDPARLKADLAKVESSPKKKLAEKYAPAYRANHQPGALQKQLLASAGLKVDEAKSARSRMFQVAKRFRQGPEAPAHGPSVYRELRHRLDAGDFKGASEEFARLRASGVKATAMRKAFGIGADGTIHPEVFTGGKETEKKMLRSLQPEERKLYHEAQKEHVLLATRLRGVARVALGQQRAATAAAPAKSA